MTDRNENKPGYKKTPVGWIPKEWESIRLGALVSIQSGNSPAIYKPVEKGRFPFVKVDDMNLCARVQNSAREFSDVESGVIPRGSTIFAKRGAAIATNKVRFSGTEIVMDSNMMALVPKPVCLWPEFLFYRIQHENLYRIADTSPIPQINNKHINPHVVPLPTLAEQKNIAEILSTWDEAIEQTRTLIAAAKRRKKGIMQQLLTGKKRLPGFAKQVRTRETRLGDLPADWPVRKISDVFEKVRRKNAKGVTLVLSASGQNGLVDQTVYFNKTVASQDLSGYYLLHRGEFAYNRSAMAGYPYGAIKRLDRYAEGVLSTLYSCFSLRVRTSDPDFYAHIFENGVLNPQLRSICQVGGRAHGLLNVTDADFYSLQIHAPPIEEQRAIAAVLTTADDEIKSLAAKCAALERQKKGLMQKLLTGEVRVKR